ncbi:MAG: hypothetical protein EOP06_30590, partial [Proteobacteria bacterium]
MNIVRAYRFRLYPNREQVVRLVSTLETCRRLYNDALAARIYRYEATKENFGYPEQCRIMAATKNDFEKAVHSHVLQDALRRLDGTYKRFFDARKTGRAHGFPRFKSQQRYNSFRFPETGFKLLSGNTVLRLFRIGDIRIVAHRDIEGVIKTCSIIRESGEWYAVFTARAEKDHSSCESPALAVGVDVGIESFATLSTGETIANPRHLKRSAKKLARLQRRLSRKKKGGAKKSDNTDLPLELMVDLHNIRRRSNDSAEMDQVRALFTDKPFQQLARAFITRLREESITQNKPWYNLYPYRT